jgi:aspartyl-tRNA(Asn)/glutamyl-tRNA(Gln) amidotransferase subunit B
LDETWKQRILSDFPELPLARKSRFVRELGIPEYDAEILTGERSLADYFEEAVKCYGGDPKRMSNWIINDVMRIINASDTNAEGLRLSPKYLAEIVKLVDEGVINPNTGKSLLEKINLSGKAPRQVVDEEGLGRVSDDDAIRKIAAEVLAESPKEVESYKAGKATLMGWFVGQVMRKMKGKADPQTAKTILEELLK